MSPRRRSLLLLLCVLALFLSAPLIARAFDPVEVPDIHLDLLPGTYSHTSGKVQHVITFLPNLTFKGRCLVNGQVDDEYEGTWTTRGNYIGSPTLLYTYTKSRKILAGTKDADFIVVLNQTALTVYPEKGKYADRRIWWRVPDKRR